MPPHIYLHLHHRYELTGAKLGEGSFAVVKECKGLVVGRCVNGWMREIGKSYAVKIIEKNEMATMEERESNREQVLRETELLMMVTENSLRHNGPSS